MQASASNNVSGMHIALWYSSVTVQIDNNKNFSFSFWATVCETVRTMLSDCCLSVLSCPVCLSVLSVTLVYCGQTFGWIKMKLGVQVGLGPGHIVLDGDLAFLPKGA